MHGITRLLALILAAIGVPAGAANLTIALSAGATGFDPHFYDHDPTNALVRHVFDSLVGVGPSQQLVPALAESWTPIDDLTWEFKLRRGVRFHNGAPFTAADVKYSFERALAVTNSPGSFAFFLKPITRFEAIDDFTIRLTTAGALPILPNYLSAVFITGRSVGDASSGDFNTGKAAIGTGPFKLVSFSTTDRTVLAGNADYWGAKSSWDEVRLDVIPNPTARIAALLSGNIDVIEQVPTASMQEVKRSERASVWEGVSNRAMFINLLVTDDTPGIAAKDGATLANPLKDRRVRQALSAAIDRAALVDRVMEGQAIAAGQIVPPGFHGFNPDIKPPTADAPAARRLLADAGLPNGFKITLAGTSDRYPNDRRTLEAVAQMWTRIGVDTQVEGTHPVKAPGAPAGPAPPCAHGEARSTATA